MWNLAGSVTVWPRSILHFHTHWSLFFKTAKTRPPQEAFTNRISSWASHFFREFKGVNCGYFLQNNLLTFLIKPFQVLHCVILCQLVGMLRQAQHFTPTCSCCIMPLSKELNLKGQQYTAKGVMIKTQSDFKLETCVQTCFKMYKNILLGMIIWVWSESFFSGSIVRT